MKKDKKVKDEVIEIPNVALKELQELNNKVQALTLELGNSQARVLEVGAVLLANQKTFKEKLSQLQKLYDAESFDIETGLITVKKETDGGADKKN